MQLLEMQSVSKIEEIKQKMYEMSSLWKMEKWRRVWASLCSSAVRGKNKCFPTNSDGKLTLALIGR